MSTTLERIKALRAATGLGLKEAHQAVMDNEDAHIIANWKGGPRELPGLAKMMADLMPTHPARRNYDALNATLTAWGVERDVANDRIAALEVEVERLTAALAEEQAASLRQAEIARDALTEAERLRVLVSDAYVEGHGHGAGSISGSMDGELAWTRSRARATLPGKEGAK